MPYSHFTINPDRAEAVREFIQEYEWELSPEELSRLHTFLTKTKSYDISLPDLELFVKTRTKETSDNFMIPYEEMARDWKAYISEAFPGNEKILSQAEAMNWDLRCWRLDVLHEKRIARGEIDSD